MRGLTVGMLATYQHPHFKGTAAIRLHGGDRWPERPSSSPNRTYRGGRTPARSRSPSSRVPFSGYAGPWPWSCSHPSAAQTTHLGRWMIAPSCRARPHDAVGIIDGYAPEPARICPHRHAAHHGRYRMRPDLPRFDPQRLLAGVRCGREVMRKREPCNER